MHVMLLKIARNVNSCLTEGIQAENIFKIDSKQDIWTHEGYA